MILSGRKIYPGTAQGEALVTSMGISFFGGVDPESGVVVERGHELEGQSIAGKVLVFPSGKGSTVGSYTLYRLKRNGMAPAAILNAACETITAVGCIIAEIPCVDQIDLTYLRSGQSLQVDAERGEILLMTTHSLPDINFPIPEPLRGKESGSFAEDTLSRRLPGIALQVLEEGDWSPEAAARLRALADEMPHGRVRPLQDGEAPDAALWRAYLPPYLGKTWLEAPWFPLESYFFRRILEATGYFQDGPGCGIDPYRAQKARGLAGVDEALEPACRRLEQIDGGRAQTLERLLRTAIWGNQADLSVWPEGGEKPERPGEAELAEHLLVDDSARAGAYLDRLVSQGSGSGLVAFVLDNSGIELAYDLLLADALLASGLSREVRFQAKPYPTYVSDVTIPDVGVTIEHLAGSAHPAVQRLAGRLKEHLESSRLSLQVDDYWVSPLMGWEMPAALRLELAQADLLISKGDANYRRWLGDRHWPFSTPFDAILAYRPAPLLALRVMKSEIVAGLPPGLQEQMYRRDPTWLYNGRWGVIQLAG
jgi:predicted aconitase with swiveling domain